MRRDEFSAERVRQLVQIWEPAGGKKKKKGGRHELIPNLAASSRWRGGQWRLLLTVHPGGQAQIPMPRQMPPFWQGQRAWHFLGQDFSQLEGRRRRGFNERTRLCPGTFLQPAVSVWFCTFTALFSICTLAAGFRHKTHTEKKKTQNPLTRL